MGEGAAGWHAAGGRLSHPPPAGPYSLPAKPLPTPCQLPANCPPCACLHACMPTACPVPAPCPPRCSTLSAASTLAPLSSSSRATSKCPFCDAMKRPVTPSCAGRQRVCGGRAGQARRRRGRVAAPAVGVKGGRVVRSPCDCLPACMPTARPVPAPCPPRCCTSFAASTLAPLSSSSRATSKCPFCDAMKRPVTPSCAGRQRVCGGRAGQARRRRGRVAAPAVGVKGGRVVRRAMHGGTWPSPPLPTPLPCLPLPPRAVRRPAGRPPSPPPPPSHLPSSVSDDDDGRDPPPPSNPLPKGSTRMAESRMGVGGTATKRLDSSE